MQFATCQRIAKHLENHGIRKIPRQNGKNPLFDAHLIRLIVKNPACCGKIAYGCRESEKGRGTRNEYKLVELPAQAKKSEPVNRGKDEHVHLLSGIVKCPV